MFKTLTGRLVTIAIVLAVSLWQLYSKQLKLGLDLQGGMHLVLEVADPDGTLTDDAKAAAISQAERIVRSRIDELGVEEPLVQTQGAQRLIVELAGIRDQEQARAVVSQAAFLQFKQVLPNTEFARALERIDRAIVQAIGEDSLRAMGRDTEVTTESTANELESLIFGAADSTTATDSSTVTTTDSTVAVDSSEVEQTPITELRPLGGLLLQGNLVLKDQTSLGDFLVDTEDQETVQRFLDLPDVQRLIPRGQALHWAETPVAQGGRTFIRLYVLTEDRFMDGSELEDATAGRDPQFNQAQVRFELSRAGGRQFSNFTGQHVGDLLAILLDEEVISAPVIRDRIGASGQIDMGNGSLEEARDLALVLRAGALPVPLEIIEERTVGPSLGADSIERGRMAGIIGLALVIVIMMAYYRVAGVLAVLALGVYVALVLGGLAGLGANLSLPGIAGLILSVGMAVDANVLIFERVREETALGRASRTAVDEGFQHAMSAIVDANITTLITALILYQFGTGPVRGFAVTLWIGIIASFFSALFVTRTFFLAYLHGKKASDPVSI